MASQVGEIWIDTDRLSVAPRPVAAPGQRRRSAEEAGGDGTIGADLIDTLRDADFDVVADLAVTDLRRQVRRGPASPGSDIAVPVSPGESAVLLVETADGALHWQRPLARDAGRGAVRSAAGPRADLVHFSFDGGGEAGEAAPLRRGPALDWAVDKLVDPVRTLVLRFVVSRTIDAAVARIEGGNPMGPVAMTGTDPSQWIPGQPVVPPADWSHGRILLMVHGTFSSTAGSFAGLAANDEGTAFLAKAQDHYDLVLGHDHRTLAEDPTTNAEAILATLTKLAPPPGTVVDAVAYSRGGLVLRALVEQLLPASGLDVKIGTAIFVGCTNGGTHLAEPLNWTALVDSYTNILVQAGRGVAMALAAPLSPFVTFAIRTIGRFVQMFSEIAISDRRVPGLAAMEPGSPLIVALNDSKAPVGAGRYHTVTSSFEPDGGGTLPTKVAAFVLDRVTDKLFGQPNDCVVDTKSMTTFGAQDGLVGDGLAFGDTAEVYHTTYFHSPKVAAELNLRLFPAPVEARRGPLPAAAPAPQPNLFDLRRFGSAVVAPASIIHPLDLPSLSDEIPRPRGARAEPPAAAPAPAAPVAAAGGPPPSAAPETVERFVAAETMPFPDIERDARIYVTLAGSRIEVTKGAAAAATDESLTLATDRPVEIALIPRRNVALPDKKDNEKGIAIREVDPAVEQTIAFVVRGIAVGPAELTIEIRQDNRVFASFMLSPTFVASASQPIVVSQPMVAPDAPDNATVLRIYETVQPNGALALRFELVGDDPRFGIEDRCELAAGFDLGAYVGAVLGDIEAAWNLSRTPNMYATALARFVAGAKTRTQAMMPASIRHALWQHRDEIDAIQVISDVPLIPWELMALVPPPGEAPPADPKLKFLGDLGLVRWLPGVPLPGRTIGLSGARSHYVIPTYVRPGANLPGAAEEQGMLTQALPGIQPVEATSLSVEQFLQGAGGDVDVVHFACHGLAEQKAVLNSYLLMAGFPGTTADDPLTVDQVKASACFAPKGGRSLVFLNACQTGRDGEGIAGVAGFADAFVRPLSGRGAAAFVGALWSVTDSLAQGFATTFYDRLKQGDTLVKAIRAARQATQTGDDFTWLAYTVYGNPFAKAATT